ncbi:MAG TPA: hypothetical protein DEO65_11750 [Bacillus bacterium]|uniref:Uncharacterized protein n=1 Tax=Siminovitchia fordii TaxID=254759 RepID=A0ABQ4K6N8_9BACI|nr:hypothetical protein J1TS3_25380 [Siminovitchia fordii]HBZ10538.1 hypothetical protein [Bacillus sp. (in: firmicutes)]
MIPILNDDEEKQLASRFYKLNKYTGLNHNYIVDKRTNELVKIISGQAIMHQVNKDLDKLTAKDFFTKYEI